VEKFIYFIILEISIGIFLKSYGYLSFYSSTLFFSREKRRKRKINNLVVDK